MLRNPYASAWILCTRVEPVDETKRRHLKNLLEVALYTGCLIIRWSLVRVQVGPPVSCACWFLSCVRRRNSSHEDSQVSPCMVGAVFNVASLQRYPSVVLPCTRKHSSRSVARPRPVALPRWSSRSAVRGRESTMSPTLAVTEARSNDFHLVL